MNRLTCKFDATFWINRLDKIKQRQPERDPNYFGQELFLLGALVRGCLLLIRYARSLYADNFRDDLG